MTLQKRLLRIMRQRNMKVADLARHLGVPYTTVREWVLHGREPVWHPDRAYWTSKLKALEQ